MTTAPQFPAAPGVAGDVTAGESPSDRGGAVTAGPVDVQTHHPSGFATSADRNRPGLCECGCGRPVNPGRRFVRYHNQAAAGVARIAQTRALDDRFIAYYTGVADARNGRPYQGNPGDHTYTRGYNNQLAGQAT